MGSVASRLEKEDLSWLGLLLVKEGLLLAGEGRRRCWNRLEREKKPKIKSPPKAGVSLDFLSQGREVAVRVQGKKEVGSFGYCSGKRS